MYFSIKRKYKIKLKKQPNSCLNSIKNYKITLKIDLSKTTTFNIKIKT